MTTKALINLLQRSPERLERMWAQDPSNNDLSLALTVNEFMADHGITNAKVGVDQFQAFKRTQRLNLGADVAQLPLS